MRRLHSKETAIQLLRPHLATLEKCLRLGWADWERARAALATGRHLSPRARAGMVYDFVVAHARQQFLGAPGVRVRDHQFLTLLFGNEFVVRFKKLNPGLLWSGIPTEQQQLFERQHEIEGLPPRATFLVAGYVLNATGTQISRIVLTCRDAAGLLWWHDLGGASASGAIVPMPNPQGPSVQQTLRSKIRKEDKEAK